MVKMANVTEHAQQSCLPTYQVWHSRFGPQHRMRLGVEDQPVLLPGLRKIRRSRLPLSYTRIGGQ